MEYEPFDLDSPSSCSVVSASVKNNYERIIKHNIIGLHVLKKIRFLCARM